jgi:hypothetical protein
MRIKGKQLADTLRDEDAPFSRVYASQLTGGLVFKAKNASAQAMTVGQAVYISGVSGEVPEVLLADADGAGTMPAAGLIATGGNAGAEVWIISLGELKGVNTSTFSEGDTLYVGTTAGALVASPPAGSSAKLQNIGRVVRADAAGVIFVGGAGRSAATPNLDEGTFFIGNASNQSSASVYTLPIADGNAGDVLTTDGAGAVTFSAPSGGATTPTLISANTGLSADTHYVVDPSITSGLLLNVPSSTTTDGAQIHVTNLSTQTITVELYDTSAQGRLYYADGTRAPTVSTYREQIAIESQGTIRLYQAGAGNPVEWYLYHSPAFEVEAATDELDTAQALAYNAGRKAFVNAGEIHGEKILSANIVSTVYPYHLYATAYDEATARTVSLPDRYNSESLVSELDGQRLYFENRGTTTLTVDLYDNYIFQNSISHRAYLRRFDNTQISGNTYTLQPGERVEVEVEVEDVSASDLRVYYRLGKHRPIYDTTTDTSGTNSTISHGREQHLTYIVDTANNVSVTLPSAASVKPSYRLTVKSIGAGTTTVSRAGADTFDGQTSTDLSQFGFITLQRESSSTWSVVGQTAASGGGGSAPSVTVLSGNATENLSAPSGNEEVYILEQADVDVYMVSASTAGEGFKYHFKYSADGGYNFLPATINVNGSSSDTIDDSSSTYVDIANIYDALTLVSDGTSKWYII